MLICRKIGPAMILILILGCICLAVLYNVPNSPVKALMETLIVSLHSMPKIWQAILFILLQAVVLMLALPATPLNLASGALFGFALGSIISVIAIDLSSVLAFFVARYLFRDCAENYLRKNPRFQAVIRAVERRGWYIIFLVRLAPLFPYGVCSYLFGVSNVKFWHYFVSTTCGMVPGTIAYTYLGTLATDLAKILEGGYTPDELIHRSIVITVAAGTTAAATAAITIVARKAWKNAESEDGPYEPAPEDPPEELHHP